MKETAIALVVALMLVYFLTHSDAGATAFNYAQVIKDIGKIVGTTLKVNAEQGPAS